MAKKKQIQKPLLTAALLLVMLVSFIVVLKSYPGGGFTPTPLPPQKVEVRDGTQVAKVTILPADGTMESSAETTEDTAPDSSTAKPLPEKDSVEAEGHVQFKIDRFQKLATQPLKFQIFEDDGREITPDYLETIRGAKVHFYLAHADLGIFHHFAPNYSGGVWNAKASMPRTGTYYAYTMVDPLKGDPVMYRNELVVRAESADDVKGPDPTAGLTAYNGPASAVMEMKRFDSYRGFLFEVKRDGNPVSISPHFESVGQMTLLKEGDPTFMKVFTADTSSEEHIGKVSFSMEHLQPGRYTAFLEVRVGNAVYIFSHSFDIGT